MDTIDVYVAEDFSGRHVYAEEPNLVNAGGCGNIWCGYRVKHLEKVVSKMDLKIENKKYKKITLQLSVV